MLRHLFATKASKRVIVFAASKLKVKELTRELRRAGYNAAEMHSDLEQSRRDEVMHEFRTGRLDILIATDILARGIDIDDIALVVNYDVPREAEDYVHRIGRTARAGMEGAAVTLVGERDRGSFASIERFLGKPVRREDVPEEFGARAELSSPARDGGAKGGRGRGSKGRGRGGRHGRGGEKREVKEQGSPEATVSAGEAPAAKPDEAKKRRRRGGRRHRRGGAKPAAGEAGQQ